ncbi:MAG TPA: phage holin family protein [Anaerolineae bacterium]|nr:phage holin family protein [Anaerolineae bacterium]HID84076.1 phage holin family protein [Anaerolineales bacterium]HIQ09317.1 phage holin family protein [Anaerolineaceae bacterium]
MSFVVRWLINALTLFVAVKLVPGIHPQTEHWTAFLWLGLIFGLVNALLRPVLKLLTCPFILLTLGLFTLVINALLFWLAGWIGWHFGVGFRVESFWAALLGALVSSLVSIAVALFIRDEANRGRGVIE